MSESRDERPWPAAARYALAALASMVLLALAVGVAALGLLLFRTIGGWAFLLLAAAPLVWLTRRWTRIRRAGGSRDGGRRARRRS